MESRGNYYLESDIQNDGVAQTENWATSSNTIPTADNMFKTNKQYSPNVGVYFGTDETRLSENIYDIQNLITEGFTSEEALAEQQSTLGRIGNALVNNAVIAGTTAISGTLGLAWGVFDALANGELSKLWDNPINRQMFEWQQQTAEAAPIYQSKEYKDSSVWKRMGSSIFWADLIKNLGYTEGMLIPGIGTSKLLSSLPKTAQIIGSSIVGAIPEASIEALSAKQDKQQLETNEALQSYAQRMQNLSYEDRNILEEQLGYDLKNIEDDANTAGNFVLGYNMAVLTLSNALEWSKLLGRGNKATKRIKNVKDRAAGISSFIPEGEVFPQLAINNTGIEIAKIGAKALGKSSVEMAEEVLQEVGVKSADLNPEYNSFNDSIYNSESRELASNLVTSMIQGFSETMKDPETATIAAMGFFTGVLGAPTLQNPKTPTGWQSPLTMEGNAIEAYREFQNYQRRKAIVSDINNRLKNSKFNEYYKGIVQNLTFQNKANQALDLNDEFNFRNYEFAQLISDIIMFDNVGQIDMLKDNISKINNFTDEEIQELIDTTTVNGVGPFAFNGNKTSVEDARAKIKYNTDSIIAALDNYLEDKDLIEAQKGNELSKEAIENMLYAKAQIRNWQSRQEDIVNTLYDQYTNLTEQPLNKVDFKTALINSESFRSNLKTLNTSELTADIANDLNTKINDVSRISKSISKFTSKINEYWNSPTKANGEEIKSKSKALELNQKKKAKTLKDKLSNIQSIQELKKVISETQDINLDSVLKELENENNPTIKELNKTISTRDNIESKIRESKEDSQAVQDAITLLNNAFSKVESEEQLKDLQSELYNDSTLLEELDSQKVNERLVAARVVLQQALNDSTSESSDTDSVVVDMEIPDVLEGIETDAPDTPIEDREVGNSGVSKAKSVNNTDIKEVEQQEIKDSNTIPSDDSSEEDIKDESNEDVEYLTDRDEDTWNPAISEFHRSSLKKGQFVSTAKADSRFKDVWKYLYDNNAFEFVNKGNLKVGDTLYFGLVLDNESQWVKDSVFVYVKTDVGYQVLNTLYLTREEADFKKAIIEEYNNSEKQEGQTQFISSYTSKVASLKIGVTQQSNNRVPLETAIEGTEITPNNMVLSVIRGVKKETGNFKDSNNEIGLPDTIGKKNGWTYIEIPNVKRNSFGGRTSIPIFVTDYGKQTGNFENTQINKRIQNAIKGIATATNYEELKQAFGKLQKDLTTKKLALFLTPEGNIRINERLFNSEGKPVLNSEGKEAQRPNTVFKTNRDGSPKSVETIIEEIDNLLKSMNLRFRTNAQYINTSNYNQELLNSGILSSYLVKAEERNAWFTIEPVYLEAFQQKEVTEVSEQPKEEPLKQTPIESFDLNLDDLMSDFGGEMNTSATPDREYSSKTFDTKVVENVDVNILLNNGYSQEDINKMSPEEIKQAKQCLGF